jgi:dihydrofolate reductase
MNQKRPIISFVVAIDKNRVMGCDNQLPWHMPADLQHFKKLTLNKTIVMGRKTYESIGRPLPLRRNIILTHDKNFIAEGCEVFHCPEDILNALSDEQ